MSEPKPECVPIACTHHDGSLSLMWLVTNDFRGIKREASTETIEAEIRKALACAACGHASGLHGAEGADVCIQLKRAEGRQHERCGCKEWQTPIAAWRIVTIEEAALAKDREFRNSLVDRDGQLVHDLPRAREACRRRLRQQRAPLLSSLDTAYMRADESGDVDEKQRIAGEKQRLRDLPAHPAIEEATSIEDLRAIRP